MNGTYRRVMMASIGVALLLITIGIFELATGRLMTNMIQIGLRKPLEALNRQDISQPLPESNNVEVYEAAPDTSCCEPTAVTSDASSNASDQNTMTNAPPVEYTTIYWQDDFTSTSSGWEAYFEIKGELPVYKSIYSSTSEFIDWDKSDIYYTTANATAWNGYDNGSYSFTLPGAPMSQLDSFGSSVTKYLWDFNISQPLPAYPYMVDVSAETNLMSGAMVVLDFSGDVSDVSAGSGILVMIPMSQNKGIYDIGHWNNNLQVWEFRNNRTWSLGCTQFANDGKYSVDSPQIDAQFVVDQTSISMYINGVNASNFAVTCERAFSGDSAADRFLGLGSRYWNLQVPVPYASVLRFHDVVVAKPDLGRSSSYVANNPATEIRDVSCPVHVELGSEDISLDDALTGACFDAVLWVTDPNPLAQRVMWPTQTDIFGRWQCDFQAPFANFDIRREQDYAVISMAGFEYRVVATTMSDYPFMVVHQPWGSDYDNNTWHIEAQVGDSISSPSRIWYGLKLNSDGSLQTSWMNPPCYRVN